MSTENESVNFLTIDGPDSENEEEDGDDHVDDDDERRDEGFLDIAPKMEGSEGKLENVKNVVHIRTIL